MARSINMRGNMLAALCRWSRWEHHVRVLFMFLLEAVAIPASGWSVFRQPTVKISKIVLLALSAKEAKKLESKGMLRPGFTSPEVQYCSSLRPGRRSGGLGFECRHWVRFALDFHGFLHGSVVRRRVGSRWQGTMGCPHATGGTTEGQ